jgi:hypothetical protein
MDFVNETKLKAGWTLGFEPDGRELLVVAVKATFLIPKDGEEPVLAETQVPLTEADEFTGKPGFSATRYETDYAHRKPCCDALLNGSAYAPGGRPAERVTVAMRVGSMTKSFNVVGDRVWDRFLLSSTPTPPRPFAKLPISYDRAFGGVDVDANKPEKIATYIKNPIGVGYYPLTKGKALVGKPLPNTEEIGHPVKTTEGRYLPMSFGPIGRNFEPRIPFAGTYDKAWLESRAPFWPVDFDYRYFQTAPVGQQIPYPKGGEQVILKNLSPQGTMKFQLPRTSVPILFIRHRADDLQLNSLMDTLLIEPDQNRFMLTWRTSLPLRRNCFEISQVVVGKMAGKHEEKANPSRPCGGC